MESDIKNRILRMLIPENRVQIDVTSENDNRWNNAILPVETKKIIDTIFLVISETASDNRLSTAAIVKLIDDKKAQINAFAQNNYKSKILKQYEKINELITNISDEAIKLNENKDKIDENMQDKEENEKIAENVVKELNISIYKMLETFKNEAFARAISPQEASEKINNINMEIINRFRKLDIKNGIIESLNLDDKRVASRINEELEKNQLEKTAHQKFVEEYRIDIENKLPDNIFEDEKESKEKYEKKNDEEIKSLPDDVIR